MGKTAEAVPISEAIRRSLTIPSELAAAIDTIAEQRHVTSNSVIVDFIREGIASYKNRRAIFLKLTDRFQNSTDPAETERLREELMRMTFGG